jgi:hypothetical protein
VDPRASLDGLEKRKFLTLPGLELPPLRRSARSQSLYRLRYSSSPHTDRLENKKIKGGAHRQQGGLAGLVTNIVGDTQIGR